MTQTDKRFHITVLNDNTVKFVDYMVGTELLTISFKEHSDAVDCQNALQWQCDLMNDLYEDKEYYQTKAGKCEEELLNLRRENKELKEKNKFILEQIRAFRDDCYTAIDFDGASTLNRLLDILGVRR